MNKVFDYTNMIGPSYGMENLSLFLYAIVKMRRPELVIEFGTGACNTAIATAAALKELNRGKLITADNGSQWNKIKNLLLSKGHRLGECLSYTEFITGVISDYKLGGFFEFQEIEFPDMPIFEGKPDLVIVDYESQPSVILDLFRRVFPLMNDEFSIFIDGASTYLPTFLFLERLIGDLEA